MYAQKPPLGPGMAMLPQPAKNATIRGPKSRTGFHPAWVSGPNMPISMATVSPTMSGARFLFVSAVLRLSNTAKMTNARIAVPNPSMAAAAGADSRERAASSMPNAPGSGKCLLNIIAEYSLPGAPRM